MSDRDANPYLGDLSTTVGRIGRAIPVAENQIDVLAALGQSTYETALVSSLAT